MFHIIWKHFVSYKIPFCVLYSQPLNPKPQLPIYQSSTKAICHLHYNFIFPFYIFYGPSTIQRWHHYLTTKMHQESKCKIWIHKIECTTTSIMAFLHNQNAHRITHKLQNSLQWFRVLRWGLKGDGGLA